MSTIRSIQRKFDKIRHFDPKLQRIQEALGRIETKLNQLSRSENIHDYEFRVFSQNGEDGLIQHLMSKIEIPNKTFVEFGVENFTEANTRFLLVNNYWAGLIIDGSQANIDYVQEDRIYGTHNLTAVQAFITKDNINELLLTNGISGDIGLLSIDIDGNDYWIWEAINCISPRIVICEYNSLFGPTSKVTIPYQVDFIRKKAHYSMVYYGASLAALNSLAGQKGYSLLCSNSAGNNAFFIRNDLVDNLPLATTAEAYKRAQFRESHDTKGKLTYANFATALKMIEELDLYHLETQNLMKIKDIKEIYTHLL